MNTSPLRKTPLHHLHVELGARMAPFAGYDMPISYDAKTGGMLAEHLRVRNEAGVFDVCHMGEFWVRGPEAAKYLSFVCTRSFTNLEAGRAQYCLLLQQKDGGIVDDIIVYKIDDQTFWMVVNASNVEKDFAHLKSLTSGFQVQLEDVSRDTGLIALQGPKAAEIIRSISPEAVDLKYYRFLQTKSGWIIARTGYTGEDGFEIFLPAREAEGLFKKLVFDLGVWPIGLGARDTLRLEVGFSLYGHELSDTLRPLETFSNFAVDPSNDFVGKESALKPPRYRPIAVVGRNSKPMRAEEKLLFDGKPVGWLTSGSISPALKLSIGLGLIDLGKFPAENLKQDHVFLLESPLKSREAVLTQTPFVSTARVKSAKTKKV